MNCKVFFFDWEAYLCIFFVGFFTLAKMSGGTPVGSGSMRQRHSQGYFSGNEDLEDDASSRMCRTPQPPFPRARTWIEVMENVLWLASAAFIIYFGDRNSNFISLLWKDERIKR